MVEHKVYLSKDENGDLWTSDLPPFIDNGKLNFECCDDYRKCPRNWADSDWFKDIKPLERKIIKVKIDE